MKAHKPYLLTTLLLIAFSLHGFSFVPESNEKPVEVVVDFYPNYAGHLLGVAEIGYHSTYSNTYQNAVKPADLKYLKENAELLRWEIGDEGPLTSVLISFPGYLNPDTKAELAEYLLDLNSAIAMRSFDPFYEKYQNTIQQLESWSGFSVNSYIYDYEKEIQRISAILMNNFDNFKYWVWPKESEQMIKLATVMNHQLKKLDLINKWEEITGLDYDASSYQIVLSTGMDNGPTGKSLGYEKEWCYYGENQTQLIQRICQDAGRRLLVNVCNKKYLEYNPLLCYKVYEELNEYLTSMILNEVSWNSSNLGSMSKQTDLSDIFDSIFSTDPNIKAVDLYAIALDKYSKVYSITSL